MIVHKTPHYIFKVSDTSVDEILDLGADYWKSKLYTYNTIIVDKIHLNKNEFNRVSALFGTPWPESVYLIHGESLSDKDNGLVNWDHDKGLKTNSLPWHQDNPWHPEYRFPIRILYSLLVEDSSSGILSFMDTVRYYESLDNSTKELYNNWELLIHDYRNTEVKFWYPFVQQNPVTGEKHLLINAIDIDVDFFGLKKSTMYEKGKTHIIAARNKFTHEEIKLEELAEEYKKCVNFSDNIYHHHWTKNQIVVFSNLNVVHCRSSLKEGVKRLMYRKTLFHDYQCKTYIN